MSVNPDVHRPRRLPEPAAFFGLLKPVTWFPPVWAYLCGVVSTGIQPESWTVTAIGLLLAGPVVCGMSQAANDYCDRHVDAINEPNRPVPSGRVPPGWALGLALAMTVLALVVGPALGPWGFVPTCVAVAAAWIYSVPPFRLKRDGWWGPALVALCYEGLPWFTGAAVVMGGAPSFFVVVVATLYALGAQGIMVLNDFKAMEGDRAMGIRSLPVVKGPDTAARLACITMALPQALVVALLAIWGAPVAALAIAALLIGQFAIMRVFLSDPTGRATWYSGVGVPFYVVGMMIAAFALRGMSL